MDVQAAIPPSSSRPPADPPDSGQPVMRIPWLDLMADCGHVFAGRLNEDMARHGRHGV